MFKRALVRISYVCCHPLRSTLVSVVSAIAHAIHANGLALQN